VTLVVRKACATDRAALRDHRRALLAHHAAVDAAFALRSDDAASLERALDRDLADTDGCLLVAERDMRIAGFCLARYEPAPRVLREAGRVAITEIGVDASARRSGVGRALVDAALAWGRARGAARVEVRVAARNAEGQAFWRALGFGDFVDVLDRRL
jgi:ribosomal protein S18 acetylase RimI-like enzyme